MVFLQKGAAMGTPHINGEKGQYADVVIMPGDPLRAKMIAETFLDEPVLMNEIRGMLGYTGTYKGKKVSVMGSGMGMPSIGIYSYELYKFYDVDNIIRVGSAGSYIPELKIFDVVLATGAWSESSFALTQSGDTLTTQAASEQLNETIRKSAAEQGIKLYEGIVHSSDVFYRESSDYLKEVIDEHHCCCVEMESFALFHNAKVLGKNAACLLTISDSFVAPEITTAEEREKKFTDMMKIALGTL